MPRSRSTTAPVTGIRQNNPASYTRQNALQVNLHSCRNSRSIRLSGTVKRAEPTGHERHLAAVVPLRLVGICSHTVAYWITRGSMLDGFALMDVFALD